VGLFDTTFVCTIVLLDCGSVWYYLCVYNCPIILWVCLVLPLCVQLSYYILGLFGTTFVCTIVLLDCGSVFINHKMKYKKMTHCQNSKSNRKNVESWHPNTHVRYRHSNSGPPFFLIWSLSRLWYGIGFLSVRISLNHLSIFYSISCYNSLVLLTFVSRPSCRITITYIYIKVWNNRQNMKRKSSLRLDNLQ
jgi:hypothetical protein